MTLNQKTEIQAALAAHVERFPSAATAVAALEGVSQATQISVRDGKWKNISDQMWRNIGAQVGWNPGDGSAIANGGWDGEGGRIAISGSGGKTEIVGSVRLSGKVA